MVVVQVIFKQFSLRQLHLTHFNLTQFKLIRFSLILRLALLQRQENVHLLKLHGVGTLAAVDNALGCKSEYSLL